MARTLNSSNDVLRLVVSSFPSAVGTLSLWFKPNWNGSDSVNHIFCWLYTDANNFFVCQKYSDNNFYCGWKTAGTDYRASAAVAGITSGNWISLIVTWDDTANETRMYLDGTQRASNLATLAVSTPTVPMYFGNTDTLTLNFDGDMAEVALWNRVLTSGERSSIDGGVSPDQATSDAIAYCSFRQAAQWGEDSCTNATHPTIGASPPVANVQSGIVYGLGAHTGTLAVSSGGGIRLAGHGGLCS